MSEEAEPTPFPPRGAIVHLRAQLATPGGKYRVLSSRDGSITLQRGSGSPITLSREQYVHLRTPGK
jgi:hypothetical protein